MQHLHFTPSHPDFALLSEYHQNSPRLLFGVLLLTAPAGEADNLQVDYLQKKCIEFLGKWSSVGGGSWLEMARWSCAGMAGLLLIQPAAILSFQRVEGQ